MGLSHTASPWPASEISLIPTLQESFKIVSIIETSVTRCVLCVTLVFQNNYRRVWTELCDFPLLACTLLSVLSHTHMMDLKVIRAKFLKYTPLKEDKTCLEGRQNKMILNVQENYVSL